MFLDVWQIKGLRVKYGGMGERDGVGVWPEHMRNVEHFGSQAAGRGGKWLEMRGELFWVSQGGRG